MTRAAARNAGRRDAGTRPAGQLRRVVAVALAVLVTGPVVFLTGSPAAAETVRNLSWYLESMQIPQAHAVTRGEGVVVAVVDSGVDASHRDLAGQVLDGTMFGGSGSPKADTDGHGTAMASLIAGKGGGDDHLLGVAPAAKILPVRLAEAEGGGNYVHDAYEAIRWAIDNGADVINMSFGAPEGFTEEEQSEVMRYALRHDVVLVAAAGNSGDGEVSYPAAIPGVVAVSGTKTGDVFWEDSSKGGKVVVAAPGFQIPVAVPTSVESTGYAVVSGTSASTALVSGLAALIRAKFPEMSAGNVVNRILRTVKDQGPAGRDPQYGFGTVDAYAALTAKVPHTTTYPLDLPSDVPSPHYPAPTDEDDGQAAGDGGAAQRRDRLVGIIGAASFFLVVAALLIPLVRVSLRNSAPKPATPAPSVATAYPGSAVGSARVEGAGMPVARHRAR